MFIIEQMESEVKPEPFRAIQIRPCRQSTKEAPDTAIRPLCISVQGKHGFPIWMNYSSVFLPDLLEVNPRNISDSHNSDSKSAVQ